MGVATEITLNRGEISENELSGKYDNEGNLGLPYLISSDKASVLEMCEMSIQENKMK